MKKKLLIFIPFLTFLFVVFILWNIFFKYELAYKQSPKIYDKNWILLYDVRWDKWRNTSYQSMEEVPSFIKEMILKREDKRFYDHFWVDFLSILRALYVDIKNHKIIQWASTIDQQTVKLNMEAYNNRTISQKLKEMFLATNINFHYSKDDIFLYYVNNLPFWNGIRWFKSACKIYYWRNCENLNKWQLVFLFTVSKYWKFWNYSHQAYLFAKKLWLKNYSKSDFYKFYKKVNLHIVRKAPFFIEYYKNKFLNNHQTYYKTHFDYVLYQHIENILSNLKPYLNKVNAKDACVIVMDKDQHIISMNLLRKYGSWKFGYVNGCLRKQQVGSSMKPFLYLKWMQYLHYNKDTILKDEKVQYNLWNGWIYSPRDFDLKYHWPVPLKKALWSSLNVPAVNILHKIWLDTYKNFLIDVSQVVWTDENFDDDFNKYWLSIALWTKPITPLDFAKMWTIFLLDKPKNLKQKQFLEKYWKYIKQIKKILSDNWNRFLSFPQDNWLNVDWTFAKTWTSRHFKDGWTCWGYKSNIVCVRAWNYDAEPMKDSGVNTAGVIWNNVMNYLKKE